MYLPIPLRQHLRSDISVVADTASAQIINMMASALVARNPLITAPSVTNVLWNAMGKPEATDELTRVMKYALIDPFFLRAGVEVAKNVLDKEDSIVKWMVILANMGLTGMLSFPRVYLNSVEAISAELATLQDETRTALATLDVRSTSFEDLIAKDPLRLPFARVAFVLAYEDIIKQGVFDKIARPEAQGEGRQYVVAERGMLLSAILRTLSVQTVLLRVRPLLRYLRMEQSRARLREEFMLPTLEHYEARIDRILAIPVHPWIARAEEPSLPMNRMTPWGVSTPTILLERGYLASPWDGKKPADKDAIGKYAALMRTKLDAPQLLSDCQRLIEAIHQFFLDLEDEGRFQTVARLFAFTQPRAPLPVPLWGTDFRVEHMDGMNSLSAITNLMAASYQLHLPAQGPLSSPWIGEDHRQLYYGADRIDGASTVWSEHVGSVAIAPEDTILDVGFYLNRFSPEMLVYKEEGWKGDVGAVFLTTAPPSVADLLGITTAELKLRVERDPGVWKRIYTIEGDGLKVERPGALLFYSDRTRASWLTTINLPRRGVPSVMWGMKRGLPETAMPTMARFDRDAMIPIPTVPTAGAVDALLRDAMPSPLIGVR